MLSAPAAPLLQQYFKHLYGEVGQEGEDTAEPAVAAAAAGAGACTPPAEDAAAPPPSPYLTDAPQYQSLVAHSAPAATTSLALASPPPRPRLGSQPHAAEGSSDALHRMDDLTSSPRSSSYDLQSETSEHSLRR